MSNPNDSPAAITNLIADWQRLPVQFRHFQILFVAVKGGIPAALASGPLSLADMSDAVRLPAARLLRLLRGLVWCGALDLASDGSYFLTPSGKSLLDDGPSSLAAGLSFQGEFFFNSWGRLWDYLDTGETPFCAAHGGASLFELLENDEGLALRFGAPLTSRSSEQSALIAAHPAFAALHERVKNENLAPLIVDVGGGEGRLLADILSIFTQAHGILLEMPVLEDAATHLIVAENLADRCRFTPGDMFAAVPENGDIYILKWLLHDWSDEDAVRILRCCAEAIRQGSNGGRSPRVLVIERLMPDIVDATNTFLVQADLNMLCQMGGADTRRVRNALRRGWSNTDFHVFAKRCPGLRRAGMRPAAVLRIRRGLSRVPRSRRE